MAFNVFVLGADELNLSVLRNAPTLSECRFHPLLDIDTLVEGDEIPLEDKLSEAENRLASFEGRVDALVGFWDFPVNMMLPMLCTRFDLPGPALESVVKCEHKYWSRLEQKEAIDEVPGFGVVRPDDPPEMPQGLRFPVWLKPVISASSELAFKAEDMDGFRSALAEIRAGIDRVGEPFEHILERIELPQEIADAGPYACMVEEAATGVQTTVEGYVFNGEVRTHAVIDSLTYPESSSFLCYRYPSRLHASVTDRITELTHRVISHIGLNNSTFNVEFFWNSDTGDISLLEINARHSQSHALLMEYVDGVPNHTYRVLPALGRDPSRPAGGGEYAISFKWFLRRFVDGHVRRVPTAEEIARIERAVPGATIHIGVEPGQRLSDLHGQDSYSFELAQIYTGAADADEASDKYDRCVEGLHFEIDDAEEEG